MYHQQLKLYIIIYYEVWNTLTEIENLPGLPLGEDE